MKKLFTLLTLLVAIVTGAQAQYYSVTTEEVIIFNNIYSGTASSSGYSTHPAVAWGGTASSNSKKAGDPDNDGAATSSNVPCYNVKGNGSGKNITISVTGVDKIIIYHESNSSRFVEVRNGSKTGDLLGTGSKSTYSTEVDLDPTVSYPLFFHGYDGSKDQDFYIYAVKLIPVKATAAYTVTFNAGSNGTCATTELTEESAGAGITLPSVTANEGYVFNGWFTAATGGNKIDDAGKTYHPTANVEIFAQYSKLAAPSISVTPTAPSTYKGVATTLTAEVTGAPNPTVKWYQNTAAATTDGTEVGTGLTYQPDVTTEGTFYYYAVAANGVEPSATSELVTLTVTDPNKYITGNAYYMSVDEVAVAGEKVYADDITMTIVDYEGGAANADNYVSGINSNYVAQITGTHNGWGTEFVATKNGTLSVGVIINGGKTFTLTNVTSFDYNGVQDEGNNETSESAGTNTSNTWKPSKKQWTVLTFDVVAGTTYKLSVAGSKMGFYGFEFVPALTLVDTDGSTNATNIAALNGKVASVKVERTLSPDYYNTLFLPFAMSAEQIQAAFGEGVQVATFTGMNSETQFGFGNVTAMEANVPYLVKPAQEVNGFTVEGVTISNTAAAGVVSGGYSMVGTYDTFTNGSSTSGGSIGGGSIGISIGGSSSSSANEIYYFTTSNTIKKLSSTGSIKGLRAFMVKLPAGKTSVETIVSNAGITFGGGAGGDVIIRARQNFVLNLDDDNTTTGIEAIDNGQLTIDNDAPAYNLAGQKVGKGYKGIVIINGKKVVK